MTRRSRRPTQRVFRPRSTVAFLTTVSLLCLGLPAAHAVGLLSTDPGLWQPIVSGLGGLWMGWRPRLVITDNDVRLYPYLGRRRVIPWTDITAVLLGPSDGAKEAIRLYTTTGIVVAPTPQTGHRGDGRTATHAAYHALRAEWARRPPVRPSP